MPWEINADQKRLLAIKNAALWAGLVSAIGVEAWLIVREVRGHLQDIQQDVRLHSLTSHIALALSFVILPILLIALVARLPGVRRFTTRRFIIKPFATMKRRSSYSGAAIATLLFRELSKSDAGSGPTRGAATLIALPDDAKVSIAGASVSLNWVWKHIRWLLTGRADLEIDGLFDDVSDPPSLRAWIGRSPTTWMIPLRPDAPLGASLGEAVSELSLQILRTLNPIRLARMNWGWGRYRAAIELLAQEESSLDIDADLIQIYLERDDWSSAKIRLEQIPPPAQLSVARRWLRRLNPLRSRTSEKRRLRLEVLRAQACILAGDYAGARAVVKSALEHGGWEQQLPKYELLSSRAASYMAEQRYAAASAEYKTAEREALNGVDRWIGGHTADPNSGFLVEGEGGAGMNGLVDRCRKYAAPQDELAKTLLDLANMFQSHATCAHFVASATGGSGGSEDPSKLFDYARTALAAAEQVGYYDAETFTMSHAVVLRTKAQSLRARNPGSGDVLQESRSLEEEALGWYDRAIASAEEARRIDPRNIRVAIDLAWCYFGKWACIRSILNGASQPSLPDDALVLAELLAALPSHLGEVFTRSLSEAINRAGDTPPRTREAAERLAEQMTTNLSAEKVKSWHAVLTDTVLSDAQDIQLSPFTSSASSGDSRPPLLEVLSKFLDRIVRQPDLGALEKPITIASQHSRMQDALSQCESRFVEVFMENESSHEAEAYYGMACLSAVDGFNDDAVGFLETSISKTQSGRESAAYMSRARVDHDFDSLHSDEAFEKLVGIQRSKFELGVTGEGVSAADGPQSDVTAVRAVQQWRTVTH